MSGVGFWELILVFLIGLIVLGPERLPRVASQLGTWLGQARRMTRVMKRQLEDELNLEKEMSTRPRRSSLPPPARVQPVEEKHDTFSPAHDANAVGTGVEKAADGENTSGAERPTSADDEPDKPPAEPPAQEKTT